MLGQRVTEQRKALGLSISSAARRAGINRATWSALERGERETEEYIFAGVERALDWDTGSIDAILRGDPPAPTRAAEPTPPVPDLMAMEDEIRAIIANPNRSEALKIWAEALLDQIEKLRRANQAEAEARGEQAV